MKIIREHHYEIPASDLLEIFLDKKFFQTRFEMSGINDYEIEEFGERRGKFIITVSRNIVIRLPANLPSVVRKFIKDKNKITTSIAWDLTQGDTHRGQYSFRLEGIPGEVSGTTLIKPLENGSVNQLNLTVSNSIPVVGKKLSSMMGEKVKSGLEKDHKSTLHYIDRFYKEDIGGVAY